MYINTIPQAACVAVAALLHYLFTAVFCWMLCEGIMLYLMLVVVFSSLAKKWWFFMLMGWGELKFQTHSYNLHSVFLCFPIGLPTVPVVVGVAIMPGKYGTEN